MKKINDIRKWGIILTIAILWTIFVFSLADVITPVWEYPDNCQETTTKEYIRPFPLEKSQECDPLEKPTQEELDACPGQLSPLYEAGGCPETYVCHCTELTEQFRNNDAQTEFWIGVILGALSIIGGMMLPRKRELNQWVGAGFIIGGLITLFFATMRYWNEITEIARPIVILLELLLVIWLAYKRFGKK